MIALTNLHPEWSGILRPKSGETLLLDCPNCGPSHRLCVAFSNPLDGEPPAPWQQPVWRRDGAAFGVLTVEPSIEYPCFHGWIESGQVIDISESPMIVRGRMPDGREGIALSPRQMEEFILQGKQPFAG